jgi:hypothetical protein
MEQVENHMTNQSTPAFPIDLHLSKDPHRITLDSREAAIDWATNEVSIWEKFLSDISSSVSESRNVADIKGHLECAKEIQTFIGSDQDLSSKLIDLNNIYLASTGPAVQTLIKLIDAGKTAVADHVYSMMFGRKRGPGSRIYDFSDPLVAEAATIVAGYNLGARVDIEKIIQNVESLHRKANQEIERISKINTNIEADWKAKIEGYEYRMALGAPRQYWRKRSRLHRKQASAARKKWNCGLLTSIIGTTLLAAVLFTPLGDMAIRWTQNLINYPTANSADAHTTSPSQAANKPQLPSTDVATPQSAVDKLDTPSFVRLLSHVAIFSTFIGFIAWWLRQNLRDLR